MAKIREEGYARINTFIDNNNPGLEHTEKFKVEFPELITSWSDSFAPHTDLNDALKAEPFFPSHQSLKPPIMSKAQMFRPISSATATALGVLDSQGAGIAEVC